ncbi:hypothetical protein [Paraliobacillus sp. JSM ZJ581]|uniref:hypothetical protein n=1 Tax=Paraliobacillus sp. JSM ZJ581 TaxID=3342118 RepID=UPI0035A96B91
MVRLLLFGIIQLDSPYTSKNSERFIDYVSYYRSEANDIKAGDKWDKAKRFVNSKRKTGT